MCLVSEKFHTFDPIWTIAYKPVSLQQGQQGDNLETLFFISLETLINIFTSRIDATFYSTAI